MAYLFDEAQRTHPFIIQKWDWQSVVWCIDGWIEGCRQKSHSIDQDGRRAEFSDSDSSAPQPQGQSRHAHFLIDPS